MTFSSVPGFCPVCNHEKPFSLPPLCINLAGKQLGKLLIQHYRFSENGDTFWCALCACGTPTIVSRRVVYAKSVPSCDGCLKNYRHNVALQREAARRPSQEAIIQRFWAQVDKTSSPHGCWLWTGSVTSVGYGRFTVPATLNPSRKIDAHRFAYFLEHGTLPEDLFILHKPPCTTKICVRHLYAGTQQDNAHDAMVTDVLPRGNDHWSRRHPEWVARGVRHYSALHPELVPRGDASGPRQHPERCPRGETHGNALLTDTIVLAIRRAVNAGARQVDLAKQYGLSTAHVHAIVHFKLWKHLQDDGRIL